MSKKKLTVKEEFDLRERRIKLMYPIAYAAAGLWVTLVLLLGDGKISKDTIPVFCCIISVDTLTILEIIKYAFAEFRCLKIKEKVSENLKRETDKLYDNIWLYLGLNLALSLLFMDIHLKYNTFFTEQIFTILFVGSGLVLGLSLIVCNIYTLVIKKREKENQNEKKLERVTEFMQLLICPLLIYSLYGLFCQVVIQNA